jgi:hypothetical protein
MHASPVLSALAALGGRSALALITATLVATVGHEQWPPTCAALRTLAAFGPAAASALGQIRTLTTASDLDVRFAPVAALWPSAATWQRYCRCCVTWSTSIASAG